MRATQNLISSRATVMAAAAPSATESPSPARPSSPCNGYFRSALPFPAAVGRAPPAMTPQQSNLEGDPDPLRRASMRQRPPRHQRSQRRLVPRTGEADATCDAMRRSRPSRRSSGATLHCSNESREGLVCREERLEIRVLREATRSFRLIAVGGTAMTYWGSQALSIQSSRFGWTITTREVSVPAALPRSSSTVGAIEECEGRSRPRCLPRRCLTALRAVARRLQRCRSSLSKRARLAQREVGLPLLRGVAQLLLHCLLEGSCGRLRRPRYSPTWR